MNTSNTSANLQSLIEEIDSGQLSDWKGLPNTATLVEVQSILIQEPNCTGYSLGEARLKKCEFALKEQANPLQVFANEAGEVQLFRLESPHTTQTAAELEAVWGSPASQKELSSDHIFAPAQAWSFPDRGVTLYVLDANRVGELSFSAIAFYAPTTLEDYEKRLGGGETVRYFEY